MAGVKGPECQRLLTMRLKRVQSSELIEFPENEEGYLGKIRWYACLCCILVLLSTRDCPLK